MGNSRSRFVGCYKPFDSKNDVKLEFLGPLDEGLGHSFCYIRPLIADSPAITPSTSDRYTASTIETETQSGSFRHEVIAEDISSLNKHNSSLPETTFKTISGASVSANTSTARTGGNLCLLLSGELQQPSASFESTSSFSAIPLQPVPRGSGPLNGFMSGPLERGFGSGPLEKGSGFISGSLDKGGVFVSGPIDSIERSNLSDYGHGKEGIKKLVMSISRPVRCAFSRTFTNRWHGMPRLLLHPMMRLAWRPKNARFDHNTTAKCAEVETLEPEYSNTRNLQWAHGKAGEDRVHVVLSEEQGWLFVGIYDGFSGPDAPDFLMSNLYKAIDKELEGLLWDFVDQSQERSDVDVLPSNNSLCSCSDFVIEDQISSSQLSNSLYVDQNSGEAFLPFWCKQYECGPKTTTAQGDEKVESINFCCKHEFNQVQNLEMDEKVSTSVSEANNLLEKNTIYTATDDMSKHSRIGYCLGDLLQMEAMENSEEKDSNLLSDAKNESLSHSDSRAREHIAKTQPFSCLKNIRSGSSDCIEDAVCLREIEGDSEEKPIDPKQQHVSCFSNSNMLERSLLGFKLRKICRKRKPMLKKFFPRSYHWNKDRHYPNEKTIIPSMSVWRGKSGPVDHDAVMKAMARALKNTEEAYADMVESALDKNPELALMGSCVLVMLMKDQDVYIMNLGDSRVVLAQDRVVGLNGNVVLMKDDSRIQERSRESLVRVELDRISEESPMHNPRSPVRSIDKNREIDLCKLKLRAIQLSNDHSTSIEDEVLRIKAEHVDDPQAVCNGRVKGQLKVTRAFGAEFLKQPRFNDALLEMFRVDYVGTCPYLNCEPSVVHHRLCSNDRFLVLSSDGLYEYFSNDEVISHVGWFMDSNTEGDPAQYLVAELLFRAAKKNGMEFHELLDIPHGDRRKYHDDVSVMVISLEGRIWRSSG